MSCARRLVLFVTSICKLLLSFGKAGTLRFAKLEPGLPASLFPPRPRETAPQSLDSAVGNPDKAGTNSSGRRSGNGSKLNHGNDSLDEFDDEILNDGDLMAASKKSIPCFFFARRQSLTSLQWMISSTPISTTSITNSPDQDRLRRKMGRRPAPGFPVTIMTKPKGTVLLR